ncbi:MAG TPA: VOC family protein [Chloroflexia bacterium]|nr:VOC family protein [Chloroflexia bacterium]
MFSRGISEIVLIVRDVKALAQFYQEVVGLEPRTVADEEWAWFWAGEPGKAQYVALHKGTLLFEEHSPLPEGKRWGHIHFALDVPRERLEEAVEHVRSHGVEVYGPTDFRWMNARSYYFYDPDGNLLEFWSPDA